MRLFERLVGLETEYAIVATRDSDTLSFEEGGEPTRLRCYRALVGALRRRLPVAEAHHDKPGVFAANSSAVWFEATRAAVDTGLIEGSTPECRGPVQAVVYQRAQDRLLSESAAAAEIPGGFQLLKNDRDGRGNTYGSQENYEATIATGWRLAVWRVGLAILLVPASVVWLYMLLVQVGLIVYVLGALIASMLAGFHEGAPRRKRRWLHPAWLAGHDMATPLPAGMESVLHHVTRAVVSVLAVPLSGLIRIAAFVPQRRALEAFLMSRSIIGGAGVVREDGRLELSDKGCAIGSLIGFGELSTNKPVFDFGHMLKAFGLQRAGVPFEYFELFARRQRLQIGLGDSNMAPTAELLRVATTTLILDLVESGEVPERVWPRLPDPLAALREFQRDLTLARRVALRDGRHLSSRELQTEYAQIAAEFLVDRPNVPGEVRFVCRLWNRTLEQLAEDPTSLVGRIDWVTKRQLLEEAGAELPWDAKKKIDLRYHELSPSGYFHQVTADFATESWIDDAHVERAMRSPPKDTPATMRGHYIREFAVGDQPVRVTWRRILIGSGKERRVIRLDRYRQAAKLKD